MNRWTMSFFHAFRASAIVAALLFSGAAVAAEIKGTVTAVAGTTVTIALKSDLRPNVGDKVEISFKTVDDQIPVGIWRVSKVDGATVTATVVEAEAEATIDMTAVIFSADPRRKTVRKLIPTSPSQQLPKADGAPGNAEDQFQRGQRHYRGDGVPKNYAEALKWYRKAARSGHAGAQDQIGWLYKHGEGVKKDLAEAVRWYRKAATQGLASAQDNLGWAYQHGEGVKKDLAEAVRWYRKAAEGGHDNGQNNLAYMYRRGWGVGQNYAESLKWFRKAAAQNFALAQQNIGQFYEHGWGVGKDHAEAARWYRKAADQGNETAKIRLRRLEAGK